MKILLLGSGGREHALAWKIAQSSKVEKLFIAPGNAGTASVGENVPALKADDFDGIVAFAVKEGIDMLITCGALGVDIGEAAKEAGMTDVIHFADCESLAAAICGLVKQGDYVLVKASHGLHLEAVVEALTK